MRPFILSIKGSSSEHFSSQEIIQLEQALARIKQESSQKSSVSLLMAVDPKWKTHFVPNIATVTESIFVKGTLLDLLISYELIDMNQRARIDLVGIESDQATELFKVITKRPPGSFDKFCQALDETSQGHLAKILRGR